MRKVVCVGSAIMDILVQSNDFRVMKSHQVPGGVALAEVYGGKTEASGLAFEVGGAGTNVAVALSRLGMVVSTVACVGDDMFRRMIIDGLRLEGVDVSMILTDEKEKTGTSVVLIASDGGRSIVTYRGASRKLSSKKIDWNRLAEADWIQVAALGGDMELLEDIVAFAKSKKIKVGWNPGKGELVQTDKVKRVLSKIDLVILNKAEALMLLGRVRGETKEISVRIAKFGASKVVITDGKQGAGVLADNIWIEGKAFKTKSVDDTGAGDAFVAGMVAGVLDNKDLDICLKMGLANGASQVTKIGAKEGLLRKSEVKKWLRRRLKMVEERVVY